jgi:nucleoside-diphosphate-sugar epimerase
MSQTALILGATGRFGRNAAHSFARAGWHVRLLDRTRDDLHQAAQGADVIVNAWNPPYPDWPRQVPRLHAEVIAAAKSSGATVIVPGNVYVFGKHTPAPWSETSPHAATNEMGRIRIDMEQAYRESGVRTILLRAGDFLDIRASGNWFDSVMIKSLKRGVFTYPGNPDIPHAWAYLPDLTDAAVQLAQMRHDLPTYADIPFHGYTLSGNDMLALLNSVANRPVRRRSFPWLALRLLSPFWPMGRRLVEMRYLWDTPHALSARRFNTLLPDFAHTDPARAVARALPPELVEQKIHPDQPVTAGA